MPTLLALNIRNLIRVCFAPTVPGAPLARTLFCPVRQRRWHTARVFAEQP
jgi:hypothetical protein